MKSITLFSTLAVVVSVAFGLTINTPASVVECEPTQLQWSGGTAPYYLSLVPAGQPTAPAIESFPTQNSTSYTWNVDLQSGTSFTISLKDSTGAIAYSDIVTVTAGSSSSCVNTSVTVGSGSGASATSGSGSSGAGSTAAAGTTAGATSASSKSTATTTASSSSSTQSSGAGRLGVSSAFGVAGIMGLVGAALF